MLSIVYCLLPIAYYSDVSADNYYLLVESLDTEVVAFAPMLASSYPRVIAVGEGNGDLLRVTLLVPEDCRGKRNNQFSKQVRVVLPWNGFN